MKRCFSSLDLAVKLSSIVPLVVAEKVDGGESAHAVVSPGLLLPYMGNEKGLLKAPNSELMLTFVSCVTRSMYEDVSVGRGEP